MRTVTHLYETYQSALDVAQALESAGFAHDDISVLASQAAMPATGMTTTDATLPGAAPMMATTPVAAPEPADEHVTGAGNAAGAGASVGTLLGGGAGLLAGIGAMAIPGVGPVIAAGWLVATITGAGAGAGIGGLLGALTGSGVKDEHAHVYAEGVRRGDTLVTVRVSDDAAPDAERIMQTFHPIDFASRETALRADDGWTGFDDTRGALTPEELQAERLRAGRVAF